jgi:hypothetical protein
VSDAFGPLFGWTPPAPAPSHPKPPDQAAELARCLSALERHVMAFLRERMHGKPEGRTFHAGTLLDYVQKHQKCAPDSPRRVMRALGALGHCQVKLLDRSLSLYEVIAVSEEPKPP